MADKTITDDEITVEVIVIHHDTSQSPTSQSLDFTKLLPNGFPQIHGWDEELVLANIAPNQRLMWQALPAPKLFVYTWEVSYRPDTSAIVQKLKTIISALLKSKNLLLVPH
jgi:hypothetical protein